MRTIMLFAAVLTLLLGTSAASAAEDASPRILVFSSDAYIPEEVPGLAASNPEMASRMRRLHIRMVEMFQQGLHQGLQQCNAPTYGYFAKDHKPPSEAILAIGMESLKTDHLVSIGLGRSEKDLGSPSVSFHVIYASATRLPDSKIERPSFTYKEVLSDKWYQILFTKESPGLDEQVETAIRTATQELCGFVKDNGSPTSPR